MPIDFVKYNTYLSGVDIYEVLTRGEANTYWIGDPATKEPVELHTYNIHSALATMTELGSHNPDDRENS